MKKITLSSAIFAALAASAYPGEKPATRRNAEKPRREAVTARAQRRGKSPAELTSEDKARVAAAAERRARRNAKHAKCA